MELKALIHVNEVFKWKSALVAIKNFLNATEKEDAKVVVLANGEGVLGYLPEKNGKRSESFSFPQEDSNVAFMSDLSRRGVSFLACQNALAAHDIEKKDLPGFVSIVPAGMVTLVELQSNGYAYIKP